MSSISSRWMAVGSLVGAIGVALGAFGAHGLPDYLAGLGYAGDDLARRIEIFDTAVHYQMLHALALVITGLALEHRAIVAWRIGAWAFLVGILIFSGLLKVLTVASPEWNWLGAVVPLGGLAMIAGWIGLAVGALRKS